MKMTYGTLIGAKTTDGSIRNWTSVATMPAEAILSDAQAMIYSMLRVREMVQRSTVTLSAGQASRPLPDGFLDPIGISPQDGLGGIDLVDMIELERMREYAEDGTISAGSVCACAATSALEFDARAEEPRRITLFYYGSPPLLGGLNQENFLTKRYPHILRAMTAAMVADYRHDDENYARWLQRASSLISAAQVEGDLSKRGQIFPRGFARG